MPCYQLTVGASSGDISSSKRIPMRGTDGEQLYLLRERFADVTVNAERSNAGVALGITTPKPKTVLPALEKSVVTANFL